MKQILFFMLFITGITTQRELQACHSLPLVNFSVTTSATGITINASQAIGTNSANCFPNNTTPFYLEVELACNSAANFTGLWPACGTGPGWGIYPFYNSTLNVPSYPDQFNIVEPYTPIFIPFTDLCPGTTYFLRARERNCGNLSAISNAVVTLPVSFTTPGAPPTFTLSIGASATSVCPGQPITLTGNLLASSTCAGSTSPTFSWSVTPAQTGLPTTGDSVIFTPTSSCTVTLSATGGPLQCYSAAPVSIPINVQTLPTLGSASLSPTAICVGGCVNLSVSSYTGGALQWEYSPNGITGWTSTGPTNTNPYQYCGVSATAYFRAVITSSCTTIISNVITITPVATPTITVTPTNTNICAGQNIILTAAGANNYQWNGGSLINASGATQNVNPLSITTYTIIGTPTAANCPDTHTVTVTVLPLPQVIFNPISASICPGNSIPITCGSDTNSYSWSGGLFTSVSPNNDSILASPISTTTYSVVATSPAGCISTGSTTVTVVSPPVINASTDTLTLCIGLSDTLFLSGTSVSYAWNPYTAVLPFSIIGDTLLFSTTLSQTYWITGISGVGCKDSIPIYVDVRGLPNVDAGLSDSICPGTLTQLQATGVIPANYVWTSNPLTNIISPNSATPTVAPGINTMFYVQGTDTYGCIGRDSVELFIRSLPVISFSSNITSGCTPICVNFTGNSTPAAVSCSYDFGDGNTASGCNPSHCYTTAGNYSVIYTVTDGNGCQNTVTNANMIQAYPVPQAGLTVTPPVTSILLPIVNISSSTCVGCDTIRYVFGGLPGDSTVNNPASAFDFIYSQPGTYSVTQYVTNQYGCSDSTQETIIVEPDFTFYAPNAFTPDNDGINDVFVVRGDGLDESSFELQIFNRWGKAVYGNSDMNKGWDGQVNGTVAANEVYIWRVTIRDNRGKPHDFVGHVTLIR